LRSLWSFSYSNQLFFNCHSTVPNHEPDESSPHLHIILKMQFNVSLTSTPGCSKWPVSLGSSNQTLNEFFIALKLDPCQTRIILLFLPSLSLPDIPQHPVFFFHVSRTPGGPELPHYRGFTITQFDTPLFVGLLWTSDQHEAETSDNRQIFMSPAEFELSYPVRKRPQTHAVDRATTRIAPCH